MTNASAGIRRGLYVESEAVIRGRMQELWAALDNAVHRPDVAPTHSNLCDIASMVEQVQSLLGDLKEYAERDAEQIAEVQ